MFKNGELLIYGPVGVMRFFDTVEKDFTGEIKKYYVLEDIESNSTAFTYVPCDNEKLVALMRPLISRAAAIELVEKNIEPAHWDKDNRVRAKKFREMIESSDLEKIISVIKAVYENGKERESLGKKSFILDTGIMQKAEKRLYSELSRALGITEDEASSLFLKKLG